MGPFSSVIITHARIISSHTPQDHLIDLSVLHPGRAWFNASVGGEDLSGQHKAGALMVSKHKDIWQKGAGLKSMVYSLWFSPTSSFFFFCVEGAFPHVL